MARFPEPPKLNILEIGVPDNNAGKYTLEKPHPDYGKDDNIINQYGHTIYPKMVYPNGKDSAPVIVKSPEEEAEAMGGKIEEQPKAKDNSTGWS